MYAKNLGEIKCFPKFPRNGCVSPHTDRYSGGFPLGFDASQMPVCPWTGPFYLWDDCLCIESIRSLLYYIFTKKMPCLEQHRINYEDLGNQIEDIVLENMRYSYDVRKVVENLVDNGSFLEILEGFAPNMVFFWRLDGRTIGIEVNQPSVMGGSIFCG